jgi:thiosulfate/3-mercaptopyruvate sulfurtransferase
MISRVTGSLRSELKRLTIANTHLRAALSSTSGGSLPLVSSSWLADNLDGVRVIDGTWYLKPDQKTQGVTSYKSEHIPGAVYVDVDSLPEGGLLYNEGQDTSAMGDMARLPHQLPSVDSFNAWASSVGLENGDRVVIYDSSAFVMGAARLWWTFKAMGHTNVSVLDGGLKKWKSEEKSLTADETPAHAPSKYSAKYEAERVMDIGGIEANLTASDPVVVLDARSYSRFIAGEEDEPWRFRFPDIRRGRIPGSKCLPFNLLFDGDGTMKPEPELRSMLEDAGAEYDKKCVISCGSGVTAAVIALALDVTGHRDAAVYDGAWAEYGTSDLPLATGEP